MEKSIIYRPQIKKLKSVHLILSAGIVCFVVGLMIFRPVPILPENELVVLKAKVTEIYEGGVKDVNFKLEGRKEMFYVNRGLERGLNLQSLKSQLTNQDITIKYPDHWSLLNFNKRIIHISKIEHQGKTVFTEVN
jgi:hypothetical protein